MGGFLGFVWRQWTMKPKPLPSTLSLQGKTALITGANSGLGLEAARELISRRISRLILAVRDPSKGEAAKEDILSSSDASCTIEIWPLDHESYASIAAFGQRVRGLDRLDYALLNAGVKMMKYEKSVAGHEMNVQINHLGTSAVSLTILPCLRRTARKINAPTRLTVVSSEGHFWIPFKERHAPHILARMDEPSSFGWQQQRYYTTKLLNVLWTHELAARLRKEEVVVNSVNPGFCYSGLHRHSAGIIGVFLWLFAWTQREGGWCLADAVVGHEGEHGAYLSEQRMTTPSSFVLSKEGEAVQKKVWDETIAVLRDEGKGVDTDIV
ncbi:putative 3-oxoacyl-reductase [Bimuria novae-zelandiae CBS 107.79]|uniref:Putative 3-oxoacyl-reductase n=1 Tax=Bimuria novae-zelandiae CBS 107.79 TaxID=1447943 RepID=A0A6A5VHA4_9PLEO|nr:putative 3-oxoacyl-reductase [Bimuria novae-zelandiae CBS 107.79]